ncbi:MAG TPA: T9SS type A sorting domain-containing protein [Bacteroidales bacterium]|nr:T9SS type A sorting domain-containing protein [Bacteroidales bacterium]
MKKLQQIKAGIWLLAFVWFLSVDLYAQETIALWTFGTTGSETLTPAIGTGTATLIGGTTSAWAAGVTGQGWNTSGYPAQGVGSGTAGVQFAFSTEGRQNIVLTWSQRHSATSANRIRLMYTIDGANWQNFEANIANASNVRLQEWPGFDNGRYVAAAEDWFHRVADFTSITGVNNNPLFAVRIVTEFVDGTNYAATTTTYGTTGTLRFDDVRFVSNPEPSLFSTYFHFALVNNTRPAWFGADTERGGAVHGDFFYAASRNAGVHIRKLNRLTGLEVATMNTTGIAGGFFPINDIEVSEDGHRIVFNLITAGGNFIAYRVHETDAPQVLFTANIAAGRFGDKVTLVGRLNDGSAMIYAANASATQVLRWRMVSTGSNTWDFNPIPETITLTNATVGATPAVAPLPDGSFYWNANGQLLSKHNADGTRIGVVPGAIVATGSNAMKFLGTNGNDEYLAVYSFGTHNETIRVLRIPNGVPENAQIVFITPTLRGGGGANANGAGDVGFVPYPDGNVGLYILATNNGIGGYRSNNLNITFPVYTRNTLLVAPTSLTDFSYLEGSGPSAAQSFSVSGTNLDGSNVIVTAPANYEVSVTADGTYGASVTLTAFNGTATPIWVRLAGGLTPGAYSGDVSVAGGGATAVNVAVSGNVVPRPSPILIVAPTSLTGFTYVFGSGPSAAQSFSVSGTALDGTDVIVTAPTNYLVSATEDGTYGASVTLTAFSGTATPIWVRLAGGLALGDYSGNVSVAGGGATAVNVAVSGNVVSRPPTFAVTPSSLTGFTYVEGSGPSAAQSFSVSGTDLDGTNVIVTAPANYLVSATEDGTYDASVTLSAFSGTATPIWVRLAGGLAPGAYSGNVSVAGGGATAVNVAVSGNVTALPQIGWANLQWPATGSITLGQEFNVFGQVWIPGVTGGATPAAGLQAWVGYSTQNTNPDTWTNWIVSSHQGPVGNNDEFVTNLGAAITTPGTYFFATRYKYLDQAYLYGGFNGGFWNGTSNVSGVLTVTAVPPPTFAVTFNVNMSAATGFNPATHVVHIAGNFPAPNSWNEPGSNADLRLNRVGETMIWSITLNLPAGNVAYKFFSTHRGAGWGGGEWDGDPNRQITVTGPMTVNDWFGSLNDPTTVPVITEATAVINLFPNPARTVLNIAANEMIREVRIIDMLGQVVYSATASGNSHLVNVGDLRYGIYFVQIKTQTGIQTKRVQIVK